MKIKTKADITHTLTHYRIAIDCKALVGPRAGIGRYLYRLLEEFAAREDDILYFLYAPRPFEMPDVCRNNPRFRVRMIRFRPATLWLQTVVPVWIAMDRIDVFFGPNYAAPLVKFCNHRSVITIHDAVFARFPETMLWKTRVHNQIILPMYVRAVNSVITDSIFSANELFEFLGIDSTLMKVIYLAGYNSDEKVDDTLPALNYQYILSVGTIEPRKNLEVLVKAYSMLPDEIKESVHLVLVGRTLWGNLEPKEWFEKYNVRNTSIHYDNVSDKQLRVLYANAMGFVFPSSYEGFGLPLLEAMSNGVPVLCSYTSSLGEIAGNSALLCDPDSTEDIAHKLEILINDDRLRSSITEKGIALAKKLTWEKTASETLALLQSEVDSI